MVRFGIVGFGLHAVQRLMPGFALAKNCQVVALSRRDSAKALENGAHYGIPHVFTSTLDLCRCSDVDAVLVTTPDACHLHDVLTAIGAGKPVLCEKPMAMNADQCRQMVEAARRAGLVLGVAQCFRFEESTARLRERVAAGDIGTSDLCAGRVFLSCRTIPCPHMALRSLGGRWWPHRRRRRPLH